MAEHDDDLIVTIASEPQVIGDRVAEVVWTENLEAPLARFRKVAAELAG